MLEEIIWGIGVWKSGFQDSSNDMEMALIAAADCNKQYVNLDQCKKEQKAATYKGHIKSAYI